MAPSLAVNAAMALFGSALGDQPETTPASLSKMNRLAGPLLRALADHEAGACR